MPRLANTDVTSERKSTHEKPKRALFFRFARVVRALCSISFAASRCASATTSLCSSSNSSREIDPELSLSASRKSSVGVIAAAATPSLLAIETMPDVLTRLGSDTSSTFSSAPPRLACRSRSPASMLETRPSSSVERSWPGTDEPLRVRGSSSSFE